MTTSGCALKLSAKWWSAPKRPPQFGWYWRCHGNKTVHCSCYIPWCAVVPWWRSLSCRDFLVMALLFSCSAVETPVPSFAMDVTEIYCRKEEGTGLRNASACLCAEVVVGSDSICRLTLRCSPSILWVVITFPDKCCCKLVSSANSGACLYTQSQMKHAHKDTSLKEPLFEFFNMFKRNVWPLAMDLDFSCTVCENMRKNTLRSKSDCSLVMIITRLHHV